MPRKPTDLSIMTVDVAEGLQEQEFVRAHANGPTRSVHRWKQRKGFLLIPMAWSKALSTMPPECHAAAYCLLRRRWRYSNENRFKVGNDAFARVGITRYTKLKALRQLEAAGLITIELRGERKSPIVTLHRLE
jgi:hypothetical protein